MNDQLLYAQFLGVLKRDGHITDPAVLSSWKLALSVHEAAPRIEAQYQYWRSAVSTAGLHEDRERHTTDKEAEDNTPSVQIWKKGGRLCMNAKCDDTQKTGTHGKDDHTTKTLQFDRTHGSSAAQDELWTLYVDPTASDFAVQYREWRQLHTGNDTPFRIRWKPPHSGERSPLVVNGYGIELALKRTDYIVIDDRQADETKQDTKASEINLDAGGEETANLKPLTSRELTDLSIKAASFVMASENPLKTLGRISQDFPKYAAALAAHEIDDDFATEHAANRAKLAPPGMSAFWINGVQINARDINVFSLLEHLRKERKLIGDIQELGFSASEAIALLSHQAITGSAMKGDDVTRYDWRHNQGEHPQSVIIWLNDLEKDSRYAQWPKEPQALLQRMYPGQLPTVALDVQNLIFPLDVTKRDDLVLVVDTLQNLVKRKIAARFGVVVSPVSKLAAEHAKIVYYLQDVYGLSAVMAYLEGLAAERKIAGANKGIFAAATANRKMRQDKSELAFDDVLASDLYEDTVKEVKFYLARLGADKPGAPYFANGVPIPSTDDWLQLMSNRLTADLQVVQMALFEGRLEEGTWLPSVFLENAQPNRNPLIVPEDESSVQMYDVGQLYKDFSAELASLPIVGFVNDQDSPKSASIIVFGDVTRAQGVELLVNAYKFAFSQSGIDVAFRSLGASEIDQSVIQEIVNRESSSLIEELKEKILDAVELSRSVEADGTCDLQLDALAKTLGLAAGEVGVLLNGRLIKFTEGTNFTDKDFRDFLAYETKKRIKPVLAALDALSLEDKAATSFRLARLTSLVALSSTNEVPEGIYDNAPGPRMDVVAIWEDKHTCVKSGDMSSAQIQVVTLLDPTSEVAQQWVPVLAVLSELESVHTRVYLNPPEKLTELPVKRFYRQVLHSESLFNEDGSVQGQSARFNGMPQDALLTITMDTPPSWLVAPKVSIHDLDNIKLSSLKSTASVTATYELEHILIEGHSRDLTNGNPPRGVQLALGTENDPAFASTIVMANLGYFQFKVNPGVYGLALQRGRSQEIFSLESAGILGQSMVNSTDIALLSFQGTTLFPRLSRKPGKRTEDVLEPSPLSADSIASKGAELADDILSKTGLADTKAGSYIAKGLKAGQKLLAKNGIDSTGIVPKHAPHADINIFSVASGHLYERMLSIMMVSVMRHTNHTVKFWFIEQFLSPSFKEFLPHLAAHYNFRFEMVTYAWPHWLRAQKEKQRVIWGYKILFLDVLFPLDLDKVIFVDADQIVRTDMYELVTHDLEGAPYGFTPMCDSRVEMEGYRFWKQGYWKNFLRGAPYHISALYVVDLKRFRAIAAGDRLRQQYHQLSADPNSLSNLDQDLPNHMQHNLPIHSLPQEWLWCETWCSDESLASARTIDLCNNPETKEPKLDRARRQVPEWNVYDEEIAAVARRVRERDGAVGVQAVREGSVQEEVVQGEGRKEMEKKKKGRDEL